MHSKILNYLYFFFFCFFGKRTLSLTINFAWFIKLLFIKVIFLIFQVSYVIIMQFNFIYLNLQLLFTHFNCFFVKIFIIIFYHHVKSLQYEVGRKTIS